MARSRGDFERIIDQGLGRTRADLVIKNARWLNVVTAEIATADIARYRGHERVIGLAELMNFPGLFAKDPEVLDKLVAFDGAHIDGHSPLVRGRELNAYLACGVRNCHETTTPDEALEKLRKGM